MATKSVGRHIHPDTKRKAEELGITDRDELAKLSRQESVKRYNEKRAAARKIEYAEHRVLLNHQLRGRDIASLLPETILHSVQDVQPTTSSASQAPLRPVTRHPSEQSRDTIPESGDSRRGEVEDHAKEAGSEQDIYPYLNQERSHCSDLQDAPTYPDAYCSDNEINDDSPLPITPVTQRGRSISSSSSSPPSPSPSSLVEPFLQQQDPVFIYCSQRTGLPPPTETTNPTRLSTYDQGPSSWAYSTQLRQPRSERPRPNTTLPGLDFAYTQASQTNPSSTQFESAWRSEDAARMILTHLKHFQGCTEEEHRVTLEQHDTEFSQFGIQHTRLEDFFTARFPSVISNPKFLYHKPKSDYAMEVDNLREAFEGRKSSIPSNEEEPTTLCVHASHAKAPEAQGCTISFDCDSHCGWPISFSAFAQGITAFFVPPKTQQMPSNLHVPSAPQPDSTFDPDLSAFLKLDDTTHIFFGRAKALSADIYVYFPNIHNPSTLLTEEQFTLWTNYILIPALHQSGARDALSSYPVSWESSKSRASTSLVEGRSRVLQSAHTPSLVEFTIDAETCRTLWENIKDIIRGEREDNVDLAPFSGAQLFFSAKNTKQQHRDSNVAECLESFNDRLNHSYNFDYIDCMIIDVGKEITSNDTKPRTAFFRDCCVKAAIKKLFASPEQEFSAPSRSTCHYQHFGTRDLKNFTATPPIGSLLASAGYLYAQWYSQVKQRFDSQKRYPFDDDTYRDLAAGEQLFQRQKTVGKANIDLKAIKDGFCHCGHRVHLEATSKHSNIPHSAREEFRMTLTAFHQLRSAALADRAAGLQVTAPRRAARSHSTALWLLPTKEVLGFVWRIVNSRVAWIRHTLSLLDQQPDQDQTRVLIMMIESLQIFMKATNVASRRNHWTHVVSDPEHSVTHMGAGFSRTMTKYGFCWLTAIVDWSRHKFFSQYREHILFNNKGLFARYKAHYWDVVRTTDLSATVTTCRTLLRTWQYADFHALVLEVLAELVLRQFREDVRQTIINDFKPDVRNRLNEEDAPFILSEMERLYGRPLYLIGKDRSTAYSKDPERLLERFFGGLNSDVKTTPGRKNFHSRPYRMLADEIAKMLKGAKFIPPSANHLGGSPFQTYLRLACLRSHNILPCPSPSCNNLTETSKEDKGSGKLAERQWITISRKKYPLERGILDTIEPPAWYTLGGKLGAHKPPPNPWKGMTPRGITDYLTVFAEGRYGRRAGIGHGLRLDTPDSDGGS